MSSKFSNKASRRRFAAWFSAVIVIAATLSIAPLPALGPIGTKAAAADVPANTYRESVSSGGIQGNNDSRDPSVSGDGRYVTFTSWSTNLVSGDTNAAEDVFVRDRLTATTARVSVSSSGAQSNASSWSPSISANGRYIAFVSDATNLVTGDANTWFDIFVRDLVANVTIRVSVSSGGGEGNSWSDFPRLSPDGKFVVFASASSNLVGGLDTNGQNDIFIRDLGASSTERISISSGGVQANGNSDFSSVSNAGRYVSFSSLGTNLVAGDTNARRDVFIRDRVAGTTSRGSVTSAGAQTNGDSIYPSISSDGLYVAFESQATNIVAGDTNARSDVFVLDRPNSKVSLVSIDTGGGIGNNTSSSPQISGNGRYVLFYSSASDLISGDSNGSADIFVRDRVFVATTRASLNGAGSQVNGSPGGFPSISADGQYATWDDTATTLVSGDTNGRRDVFLRDRGSGSASIAVPAPQTYGIGAGEHARNPTGTQADPVNSATGAMSSEVVDASMPGVGIPFEFARAYTSADTSTGPLGPGWTHSYNLTAPKDPNGDVLFRGEQGEQLRFYKQPDSTYRSDPGVLSVLKQQVSGLLTLVRVDQVGYDFDSSGKLTRIFDRNGNALSLSYDSQSRLQNVTDTVGRQVSIAYNASSLMSQVTLPDGRFVSYTYTGGRLTSVTDLRGGTTSYTYDAGGRLNKETDPNGHVDVETAYGPDGRVVEQKDAFGGLSTFTWDPVTQTSTMHDARGNDWKDVNFSNVLYKRIDPLGNTTTIGYDANLGMETVTDPRGNTSKSTYDSRGNLISSKAPAPLSYEQTFTYNSTNDLLTLTDGRGKTTQFEYDANGNLTRAVDPLGQAALNDYNVRGQVDSSTDRRGKTSTFTYDAQGNLSAFTSPLGNKSSFAYDSVGRLTSSVDPRGNSSGAIPDDYRWTYSYEPGDKLATRTSPLGNLTGLGYDLAGNLIRRTDAKNRSTLFGYNLADELVSVTAPDTGVTTYEYDASGNLVSRQDPNSHQTTFGYDAAHRLTSVVKPLGERWSYEYDASGNRVKTVDANGNDSIPVDDGTTVYSFDAVNRLVGVNYSDATPDASFTYDGNSNRLSMTDGAGTETYTYDDLNRLGTIKRGSEVTNAYFYDQEGNINNRNGLLIDYDDDGRASEADVGPGRAHFSYDPAGNLLKTNLPNGFIEERAYDPDNRLSSISNYLQVSEDNCLALPEPVRSKCDLFTIWQKKAVLTFANYSHDEVGNPTSVTSHLGTTTYTYDPMDRLIGACRAPSCGLPTGPHDLAYTYDKVGNRLSETRLPGTTTYSYDASDRLASKLTLGSVPETFGYDRNGSQTKAGAWTYSYDLAGRMKSAGAADVAVVSYTFDGDGKRLRTKLDPAGSGGVEITKSIWDPSFPIPQLYKETETSGNGVRQYDNVLDTHGVVTSSNAGGAIASFVPLYDGLGSVVAVTDSNGAPQSMFDYEPFGAQAAEDRLDPKAPQMPLRFAGEYLDPGTGLYHLRARQYDPADGRFLTTDPLPQGIEDPYVSSYIYANDRPTVLIDPTGLRGSPVQTLWEIVKRAEIRNLKCAGNFVCVASYYSVITASGCLGPACGTLGFSNVGGRQSFGAGGSWSLSNIFKRSSGGSLIFNSPTGLFTPSGTEAPTSGTGASLGACVHIAICLQYSNEGLTGSRSFGAGIGTPGWSAGASGTGWWDLGPSP